MGLAAAGPESPWAQMGYGVEESKGGGAWMGGGIAWGEMEVRAEDR